MLSLSSQLLARLGWLLPLLLVSVQVGTATVRADDAAAAGETTAVTPPPEERHRILRAWLEEYRGQLRAEGWQDATDRDEVRVWMNRSLRAWDESLAALRSVDLTLVDFRTTNLSPFGEWKEGNDPVMTLDVHDLEAVYPATGAGIPERYIQEQRQVLTPWCTEPFRHAPELPVPIDGVLLVWKVNDGRRLTQWQFPGGVATGTLVVGEEVYHQVAPWDLVPMAPTDAVATGVPMTPDFPGWDLEEVQRSVLHPWKWLGSGAHPIQHTVAALLARHLGEELSADRTELVANFRDVRHLRRGDDVLVLGRMIAREERGGEDSGLVGLVMFRFDGASGRVSERQMVVWHPKEIIASQEIWEVEPVLDAEGRSVPVLCRNVRSTTSSLTRSLRAFSPELAAVPESRRLDDREVHFLYHRINDEGIGRIERFDADAVAKRIGLRVALNRERPLPAGQERAIREDLVRYSREFLIRYDDATVILGPERNDFGFLARLDAENLRLIEELGLPVPAETIIPYASLTYLYTTEAVDTTVSWNERIPRRYQREWRRQRQAQEESVR